MSVALNLKRDATFHDDVADSLRLFLAGESIIPVERSRSSSSDSQRSSLDADKPAGVEDWAPLVSKEPPEESAEAPAVTWLGSCLVTSYSSLDYLLMCNGLRWILASRKPTDEGSLAIVGKKIVDAKPEEKEDCYITCCTIFGLGSTRMTEIRDSVVVAVGLSTGCVVFYTENGVMLFEETFSNNSPILSLSLDYAEDGHLFCVVTESDIFAVNAFSLHSNLLQCKASIAKGEKTASEWSETLELECIRIKVDGGALIRHAAFTGVVKPSSFDQYVSASIEDFNCRVDRSSLPNYTTFFVNTDRLFSTFAWLPEGENTNIWTEVVSKVTSSFVPHFGLRKFLGIAQTPARKSALSQARQSAVNRSNINDSRTVLRISKAPHPRSLIAVVDGSARVILVDTRQRQIVRIWKGYRDAQVAWVTSSNEGTTALFLAIFAARRALLEVWSVPNGVRVGAQHVDPAGFLLEGGATAVICGKNDAEQQSKAFFIDSNCAFHSIDVPFHLALVQGNTREQHDHLLIQKLSNGSMPFDAFWKLYASFKTATARIKAVLTILPTLSCPQEMRTLLNHLAKDDASLACLGDIPKRAESILHAFNLLKDALDLPKPPSPETEFDLGKETAELVRRHLLMGETGIDHSPSLNTLVSVIDWSVDTTNILEKNLPDGDLLLLCKLVFSPLILGKIDLDFFADQVLPRLPFTEATVASLFLQYFLRSSEVIDDRFSYVLQVVEFFTQKSPALAIQFEKSTYESVNVSRAILMSTAIWLNARRRKQNEDVGEEEQDTLMDTNESWEAFDPTIEHHDCTILGMHAVWLLSELRKDVSYSRMLASGAGYFREQIASWAVDQKLTFSEFCDAITEDQYLSELHALLPKITARDFLFADVGWEFAAYWFKSKADNLSLLQELLDFLRAIKDDRLRHGVAKLVWDKFLLDALRALSNVMEKTGRGPKEREAKQYLQMHDRQVEPFLEVCAAILDILMSAVRDSPALPAIPLDHFVEVAMSHPPSAVISVGSGRDSLVHIASRQTLVNYHLVLHHQHLMYVYLLVIRTGMRIRPLSTIFCSIGQRAMFHPLDSHPLIPLERVDDTTLEHRHRFLSKVAESGNDEDRRLTRHLANEWSLTVEAISLVEALSHFRKGDDVQGVRGLSNVVSEQVGAKLAKVLAARVLRLADAEKTVLTASHIRYLQETAGDETSRVDWNGDWRAAVESLSGILHSLSLQDTTALVKINSLTTLYWTIGGA